MGAMSKKKFSYSTPSWSYFQIPGTQMRYIQIFKQLRPEFFYGSKIGRPMDAIVVFFPNLRIIPKLLFY
jgi:hypothetical protein